MNRLWAVHHLVIVVYNIHTVFINWFHSKCYVHVYVSANVLMCYSSKKYLLECILDKLDKKMMPSVVHYETYAKWLFFFFFLNPISIFYTMQFTGVVHPMGAKCCYINVSFKTFHYFHIRNLLIFRVKALHFHQASSPVNSCTSAKMSSDLQLLQGFFSFECASPVLQQFGLQSQH